MRVIFLTHNYPRHAGDVPGGFLHPLALGLAARGVEMVVVAPSDRGRAGTDLLDGIPVHRVRYAPAAWEHLAYSGRMDSARRDPRALLALAGMVRALRRRTRAVAGSGPAVVHAHWWLPAGLAAPPELPMVVTLHGTDGRLLAGPLGRRLGRRVLRRARVVTTVSRALAEAVSRETGLAVRDSEVQGLPLDARFLHPGRGGQGIVAVARLTAQKRLHLLIEAAARLRAAGQPIPVTIAGDGPEAPRLQALVARLDLDGLVRLLGPQTPAEVGRLLAGADLFILPAQAEGYGLAAAEAVATGVPVVVTGDGGGLVEIAAGGGGTVADPDPDALARAIRELLSDPGARARARSAGERLRHQLSIETAVTRAMGWYDRALRPDRAG